MTPTSSRRSGSMPVSKYQRYEKFPLPDRQWPDRVPEQAPLWASVDLRDGNQALIDPMDMDRRWAMYRLLVRMGFKEIEVGFPLSSQADLDFTRAVIEQDAFPDDVTIQVMSPIRDGMIEDTVRSVKGARRAILQVYNPTSAAQRRVVFGMSRDEVRQVALKGAERALKLRDSLPGTEIYLQYGAESFTQTEPEFALEVCNAVLELWRPEPSDQVRIVLPSTVECYPPHEFADRIEWMNRHLAYRDAIILSLHQHNDRGSGIASAELALLAGADRVEGTLFGNGERAGNVDLVTLAMNLYSQGVDPQLDLSFLDEARRIVEHCNRLPVPPRQPWVGDFVYTSFAGSHQDAINKGLAALEEEGHHCWDVPYLPIDPRDVGRDYQALIRINQQSGKGGIAYLMKSAFGYELPRRLQIEFAAVVQERAEQGGEITPDQLLEWFSREYLTAAGGQEPDPAADPPAEEELGAVALARSNVDTDQIIPARFCRRLGRTGYEDTLFFRWRQEPEFPVTAERNAGASVLVTGPDFGVGSSREHAVWALRDFGFRVVVAASFGDIFRANATKNGLLTAEVAEDQAKRLRAAAGRTPSPPFTVDLEQLTLAAAEVTVNFRIDDYSRWQLLNGLDDLRATLRRSEAIDAYEKDRPSWLPTVEA